MEKLIIAAAALLLGGCVVASAVDTAVDVAKVPVAVVSAGVDAATTTQAEADEKRGRELRRMEERCRKGKPRPGDDCRAVPPQ
ncbi:MAG TPA: hypothetical protein VNH53_02020 [Sphingomicrobium sp.]|jgi:isocitrate lyase|nr:hypothetical protein [Sphingomicrobium sp.]